MLILPNRARLSSGIARNPSESMHPNLWDGLVGLYVPSVGVQGMTLQDFSGKGNHGTMTSMNASNWVGNGIDIIEANSSYVDMGDIDEISVASAGEELCLMIRALIRDTTGPLLSKDDPLGDREFIWRLESGAIWLRTIGGNNGGTDAVVTANEWAHFCVNWFVGDRVVTFFNGVPIDDTAVSDTSANGAEPLLLGRDVGGPDNFADMICDDIRVYTRTLSDQEVMQSYIGASPLERRRIRPYFFVPVADETQNDTASRISLSVNDIAASEKAVSNDEASRISISASVKETTESQEGRFNDEALRISISANARTSKQTSIANDNAIIVPISLVSRASSDLTLINDTAELVNITLGVRPSNEPGQELPFSGGGAFTMDMWNRREPMIKYRNKEQ